MGEMTAIAWTDHTFNPWWGCTRVSPGCERCYAEAFAKRTGLAWGPSAERRLFTEKHWNEPRKWNAKAARDGVRRRVFVASMADVFEDRPELVEPRARLWRLIAETPALDWLLLTKRPEQAARHATEDALLAHYGAAPWPANIWLGVTVEDQKRADERIPILLQTPAAVRFVSYEPALGPVRFPWRWCVRCGVEPERHAETHLHCHDDGLVRQLDWVIVGGESGPKARPFNPTWAKDVVNQCRAAGVACFVKQLGANVLDFAGAITARAGRDMAEWPEDLRVREFPR